MNIKQLAFPIVLCALLLSCVSCKSTDPQAGAQSGTEPAVSKDTGQEQPAAVPQPTAEDEEFTRSTHDVVITKEEFSSDKKQILEIIKELSGIMDDYNYSAWLKYIDDESKAYWSNPANLKNASKRLPVKNLRLNNLSDYFRYVFVPSRKGRTIEEIRYISRNTIKAVHVNGDQDIVFYYFTKQNGKWFVRIPPLG